MEAEPKRAVRDETLAVWADFLQFHAAVIDRLGRELVEQTGMPLTWFDVLIQLDSSPGGRLRMQDLAAAVVLSRSGLTRLVDRLQDAGYVDRTTCPSDRRGTFAEITPAGRAALARARPVHLAGVEEHFGAVLTDEDVAALARALGKLRASVGPGRSSACGGSPSLAETGGSPRR